MVTRIELIDRALLQIGAEPLKSEAAPGADTHLAIWNSVVEEILTAHTWSCSTFIRELNRRQAPPEVHWRYSFETPSDMFGSPKAVYDRSDCRVPFTGYELFGDRELRTNAERIWIKFTKLVSPNFWPGYLRAVIELRLMAAFALSIREDKALRDQLWLDCYGTPSQMGRGGKMAAAIDLDDMAKPSPVLGEGENVLLDVRR